MKKNPSRQQVVCCNVLPFALLVAYIVMGAMYLNDCPQEPYIPIYLIVLGAFGMVPIFSSCCCQPCSPGSGSCANLKIIFNIWSSMVSLFLVCWFICGNVWIYSIYQPNYNQTQPNSTQSVTEHLYCNKILYLFAFWTNTLNYLIFLGFCVFLCCCCCCGFAIFACAEGEGVKGVPVEEKDFPDVENL
ncbi:hypothetical protein UPYG_G00239840 [Umbra pygmaea]|uniref:Uncharacterized protein n=1 Tax=Umbra pygmaea TaxID=75934 RepID=A0ABD0WJX1_UMBPY